MTMERHPEAQQFFCDRIHQNGWEEIILRDEVSGCKATIIPAAGAILNRLEIKHRDALVNVVDGFENASDYAANLTNGFKSAKLSPFVCRLNQSTYSWEGETYKAEKFLLNGHAIHGLLYDAQHEVEYAEASGFKAECKFFYRYKGDQPGFPFPFDMNVTYRLEEGCRLSIITTVHNRSGRNIPMSDGWHPYFKLGETIDTATLQISANKQVEFDAALLPTGKLVGDKSWRKAKPLQGVALDNCFALEQDEPMPQCILSDATVGLSIAFYAVQSYPYLQVYTPDHRRSIAIENLSSPPDSFNNKMGLITLGPEDSAAFHLQYKLTGI
jgi:aldose 1-epimerase